MYSVCKWLVLRKGCHAMSGGELCVGAAVLDRLPDVDKMSLFKRTQEKEEEPPPPPPR